MDRQVRHRNPHKSLDSRSDHRCLCQRQLEATWRLSWRNRASLSYLRFSLERRYPVQRAFIFSLEIVERAYKTTGDLLTASAQGAPCKLSRASFRSRVVEIVQEKERRLWSG